MAKKSKIKNKRLVAYFYLTINTILWGAALIIVKPALAYTTPFRYLFLRYFWASFLALPILFYYWPKIKNKINNLKKIFALEILGTGLALSALYIGLKYTSAIEASLLTTTLPIFVVLGGIFLLKEKQEKHENLGLLIAFLGTIFLTLIPVISKNGQFGQFSIWGNLLIILHNITNLFYFPLAKKYYFKIPKLFISSVSFYIGLLFFLVLSLFESSSVNNLLNNLILDLQHISVWVAVLYMAIFGSIIALTAYLKGQENIESSEASLFWYLQPIIYIPLGFLLLQEKINFYQIISLGVILLGVMLAEKRKK